jgi:Domain of unknown function (DUF4157)
MHFTAGQSKATNAPSHDEASRSFTRAVSSKHPLSHPLPGQGLLSSQEGLLQSKCACGGTPGVDGECAECRNTRLQRSALHYAKPETVPPTVHETLSTPGQPLDEETRAFMEPRFGHDFSQVRVHADARAAESARALNARAYTVGRDVVFGEGAYAPSATPGAQLLAHELVHVVQQEHSGGDRPSLKLGDSASSAERDAERVAGAVLGNGPLPAISPAARAVQRDDVPLFSQDQVQEARQRVAGVAAIKETVTETISDAPAAYGKWNRLLTWDSKFHLTLDRNSGNLIVSVRIYSSATAAQWAAWERAIVGKWSNRYKLTVAGATAAAERSYPIIVDLQWATHPYEADYTVNPSTPDSTSDGRAGVGGTTDMTHWGMSDTTDVAHEFGHMLGNPEEYFTTNGVDYTRGGTRTGFRDVSGGIMNNPTEDPFTRHYELIRRHAAKLLGVPESRCTVR